MDTVEVSTEKKHLSSGNLQSLRRLQTCSPLCSHSLGAPQGATHCLATQRTATKETIIHGPLPVT